MIDKSKNYRTRDGREVRIYATDGGRFNRHIHGAHRNEEGWWVHEVWQQDGRIFDSKEDQFDLIEVRPRIKRTVWLNVYEDKMNTVHRSKESADAVALENRLACVRVEIDCEEGEGL